MATTIANLSARLTLDTSRFTTGLQRAQKSVKKFGGDVGRIGGQVARFGAVAGGVAVAGVAALVRSQSEFITTTQRVADRIGIATGELSRLQYAAVATGSSVDRMQEGLTELVQRLGEAKAGTGSAADGLKMIGLEAEALTRMNPAEAFSQIADAINQLPSQSDRVFAIDEIFGGDGREMINLLSLGSEGIARLGEEADRVGASFSAVDARQVLAATEATDRLGQVVTGVGRQLAIGLAPFIDATATKFTTMATSGGDMGSTVVDAIERVAGGVAKLADWLEMPKAAFFALRGVAEGALGWVIKGFASLGRVVIDIGNLIGVDLGKYTHDAIWGLGEELVNMSKESFAEVEAAHQRFHAGAASNKAAEAFNNTRKSALESAKAITRNADEQRKLNNELNATADANNAKDKIAAEMDKLRREFATFGLTDEQKQIFDLRNLGAGNEQLREAARMMAQMKMRERHTQRQDDIKGMLEDLERRVIRFGNSERDNFLMDIDALGAGDRQMAEARALFNQLASKQGREGQPGPGGPVGLSGPNDLIIAGSARAQQLAFQASRGINQQQDNIPKRQLDYQQKMARSLAVIERRNTAESGTWDI